MSILDPLAAAILCDRPDADTLFDGFRDPVWIKDASGRYTVINQAAEAVVGLARAQVLGKTDFQLVDAVTATAIVASDRPVLEHGQTITYEGTQRLNEHNTALFRVTKTALTREGHVVGLLATAQNVSDQRAHTLAIAQMARLDAAKSEFLSAASHDLRQPMQSIVLYATVLTRYVDAEGNGILGKLSQNIEAMNAILDSILYLSRLDSGLVEPVFGAVTVADLWQQLHQRHSGFARSKNLSLLFVPAAAGIGLVSDRDLLVRMLSALIDNAIRYTDRGAIEISCTVLGERVRLSVSDPGIGIAPDKLDRVYDDFYQINNDARDRAKGMGTGLSVVQRLGRLLSHPVTITSKLGQGTVVSIETAVHSVAGGATGSKPQPFIVLVDDDSSVREVFGLVLEELQFESVIADSTANAIAKLSVERVPDVLILDYRLVNETGLDAAARLRAFFGVPIPGLLLTGDIGVEVERSARQANLHLLQKPIRMTELDTAIRAATVGLPA